MPNLVVRAQRARLYLEIAGIMGLNGAVGMWRRLGCAAVMCSDTICDMMNHVNGADGEEQFVHALEFSSQFLGTGNVVTDDPCGIGFELSDCSQCRGYSSTRPTCSLTAGGSSIFQTAYLGKRNSALRQKPVWQRAIKPVIMSRRIADLRILPHSGG